MGDQAFLRGLEDRSSEYREYYPEFFEDGVTRDPDDADLDARGASFAWYSTWEETGIISA